MNDCKKEVAAIINSVLQLVDTRYAESKLTPGNTELEITNALKEHLEYERSKYLANDFNILFVGEIKTGKSSLINNLIAEDICTVNAGVCTNVNTIIKYGSKENILVYFEPDEDSAVSTTSITRDKIKDFVSERKNKNNKKSVRIIEVETPSVFLANGTRFIDTPGLGSLNPYHAATTFSIAPKADVIVFVSSADSELTKDEKDYLKRIIDCSDSGALIHVLTNADNGEPDAILKKNDLYIKHILEGRNISYASCAVSNLNYEKYRKGNGLNIKDTGFDVLIGHINRLNDQSRIILTRRVLTICYEIIIRYREENRILLEAMDNPEIAIKRKAELEDLESRITQLKNNTDTWRIKLSTKITTYKNHLDATVKSCFDLVKKTAEEKLSDDDFIKNPDKLSPIITSEIVSQTSKIERSLQTDLNTIYDEICDESGLNLIRSDLYPIERPDSSTDIKSPEVDKFLIFRNAVGGRLFAYGLAGSVVGPIIGAIVGTVTIPGIGTILGAELGGLIAGVITGIGVGVGLLVAPQKVRQAKKDKVMGVIRTKVAEIQSTYLINVKDAITKSEEGLRISFMNAIREEDASCRTKLKEINETILGDDSRRDNLGHENKLLDTLSSKTTTLFRAISDEK